MNKIEKAKAFAMAAHDSIEQKRKYSGLPYWTHTQEVAAIVASLPDSTEDMICAAHLHDVLEDVWPIKPEFGWKRIGDEFGNVTLWIVQDLTDEFTRENYPEWNRARRKLAEAERLGACDPCSKTVKLADILSNTRDIVEADTKFAITYLREKEQLLPFLKGGSEILWQRAAKQIEKMPS